MKAVFIVYNQALSEQVARIVSNLGLRGYTQWREVLGCGSVDGEPHLGTHTWPAINSAMLVMCTAEQCASLKYRIDILDQESPKQGLRIFSWDIDD